MSDQVSTVRARVERVITRELLFQFVEAGKHLPLDQLDQVVSARFNLKQLRDAIVDAALQAVPLSAETEGLGAAPAGATAPEPCPSCGSNICTHAPEPCEADKS
jgi:hypothetical protein